MSHIFHQEQFYGGGGVSYVAHSRTDRAEVWCVFLARKKNILICLTFVTSLNNLLSFSQLSSVLSSSKFSAALAINCALDSFKNSQVSKPLIYFLTFNLGHQLPFLMTSCYTVPDSLNKGSNAITFFYFKQIWLQLKLQGIVHTFIDI